MKKRVLSLVLTVCMLVGVIGGVPINVQANENFKFTLTDDTLTISGQGSLQYIPPELYDEFSIKKYKAKELVFEDGITEIGEIFTNQTTLEKVVLPNTLKSLGIYTFRGCTSLKEVVFPDAEFEILGGTFERCTNLKEVYIPASATLSGYLPFGYSNYEGSGKLDLTIYTPENSSAYKWAKDNGINVVISTREEFNKKTTLVEKIELTPVKADKSLYKIPQFKDVKTVDEYTEYIIGLGYLNLFKGDDQGNFNPGNTITRAEFATIVCRMLGYEQEANKYKGKEVFDDVSAEHWASGYVFVASELGIINGYGDGHFGPSDHVTYEQAVKMLVCATNYDNVMLCRSAGVSCSDDAIPYPDGYMAIAKKFHMKDDYYNVGDRVPRKVVARLMYEALKWRCLEVIEAETQNETVFTDETILSRQCGIDSTEEFGRNIQDAINNIKLLEEKEKESQPTERIDVELPTLQGKTLDYFINVDYASFKLLYGKPKHIMNYGGALYQFEENGPWFGFSDSNWNISFDDENIIEPSPFAVCTILYTTANGWLGYSENDTSINSITVLREQGPIKFYREEHNYMEDTKYYHGVGAWYSVSVDYNSEGQIAGDSPITIIALWKDGQKGVVQFSGSVDETNLKEENGLYYSSDGRSLHKANADVSGTIVVAEGVEKIYPNAFKDCNKITKVVLPKSILRIGANAFENCTALKEINLPTGITTIDANAFKNCDSLETVKIPHSIKDMTNAFRDCDNLKTVILLSLGDNPVYAIPFDNSPVENVVIGGSVHQLPMDYFLSGAYNQYQNDGVITNLYIYSNIDGIIGSNYGSALRCPKNVYMSGNKDSLQKFNGIGKLSLWDFENIHENANPFECPYIEDSMEVHIAGSLGAKVDWDGKNRTETIQYDTFDLAKEVNTLSFASLIENDFSFQTWYDWCVDSIANRDASWAAASVIKFWQDPKEYVLKEAKEVNNPEKAYQDYYTAILTDALLSQNSGNMLKEELEREQIQSVAKEYIDLTTTVLENIVDLGIAEKKAELEQLKTELWEMVSDPMFMGKRDKLSKIEKEFDRILGRINQTKLDGADLTGAKNILDGFGVTMDIASVGYKAYKEVASVKALQNVKQRYVTGIKAIADKTNDTYLKGAANNLMGIMNQSFNESIGVVLNSVGSAFLTSDVAEDIAVNLLKKGAEKVLTIIFHLGAEEAAAIVSESFSIVGAGIKAGKITTAVCDVVAGTSTSVNASMDLKMTMAVQQSIGSIIQNEYYANENILRQCSKEFAGMCEVQKAVMAHASCLTNTIYNAQDNSGYDKVIRLVMNEEVYDDTHDRVTKSELDRIRLIQFICTE